MRNVCNTVRGGSHRTEVATSKQTDCSENHPFKQELKGSNSTGKTGKMGDQEGGAHYLLHSHHMGLLF